MNCQVWQDLSVVERVELIGRIAHLIMSDTEICISIMGTIRQAERQGKLDNVEILPNQNAETEKPDDFDTWN